MHLCDVSLSPSDLDRFCRVRREGRPVAEVRIDHQLRACTTEVIHLHTTRGALRRRASAVLSGRRFSVLLCRGPVERGRTLPNARRRVTEPTERPRGVARAIRWVVADAIVPRRRVGVRFCCCLWRLQRGPGGFVGGWSRGGSSVILSRALQRPCIEIRTTWNIHEKHGKRSTIGETCIRFECRVSKWLYCFSRAATQYIFRNKNKSFLEKLSCIFYLNYPCMKIDFLWIC